MRIPIRLKIIFHKTVIRPAMIYGSEYWAVYSNIEQRMSIAEIRMSRWMNEVEDAGNRVKWKCRPRVTNHKYLR